MSDPTKRPGPLDGLRVLDFSMFLARPYAGRLLAEHGAEVIKIEPVTGDGARQWNPARDDIGYYFMYSNADKHALAELQGIMDVKAQAKVAELKKQAKEAATSPPEQV